MVVEGVGKLKSTIQDLKTKWENTGSLDRRAGSGRRKFSKKNQDNNIQ